jgi:hypothetical protein
VTCNDVNAWHKAHYRICAYALDKPHIGSAVNGMSEHIPIDRAWILLQEASIVSTREAEHLEKCRDCREFLRSFVSVAHYIGLSATFPTRRSVNHDDAA